MTFYKRLSLYFLLCLVPFIYRLDWNGSRVFVASDPEIKYYQINNLVEGNSPASCYFSAKTFGFSNEKIPIGYPWAFHLKDGSCVFQYPILFSYIQFPFVVLFGKICITFIPILFFFLCALLLDLIFQNFELSNFRILSFVVVIQFFTPIFLSSLDYSELTLTNFFFLFSVFSFYKYQQTGHKTFGFILAMSLSINFQLRPESTIAFVFFLAVYFVFYKDKVSFFQKSIFPLLILVIFFVFFSILNYKLYGHVLGMRGLNTMTDMATGNPRKLDVEWIADLWGNEFKIGIFKGYPILFLSLLSVLFFRNRKIEPMLVAGFVFILLLPVLSPYRAGVDIFGMRYYESGIYLLMIGGGVMIPRSFSFNWILIIILPFLYFSYKSDTRAIKIWSSQSKLYHSVLDVVDQINPDIIVHRGLSLSYLIGDSYLKYPQIAVYSNEDWLSVEDKLVGKKMKILYLEWEGNQLVNDEFPKHIWESRFDINFNLVPSKFKETKAFKVVHFSAKLLEETKRK
ncbi:hypothetical protein P3G55_04315 [Leptospira sp. 96542]|nr:hypothetical protein [Leptospira sp. 96542]